MGQVCSGVGINKNVTASRDPLDKELDEIEMRVTKLPDFDSFFGQAAEPLNKLVAIHNSIAQSEENLEAAAAAIQGEAQLRLNLAAAGHASMEMWKFDDLDNEYIFSQAEIEAKLNSDPTLRDAYERTEQAITALNTALDQPTNLTPSQFSVKRGRLFIERKGIHDAAIRDVNLAIFSLRKQLAIAAHVSSLSQAVVIFVRELAKVQDVGPLSADTNEDGRIVVMCGDQELDLRKMDKLSKPAAQLRDALVELLENVETAAVSVPELAEQSAAFAEEAQTFANRAGDAVSESDLGLGDKAKAMHATTVNTKSLSNGPKVVNATTAMMQYAGTELKQAMSMPRGG